MYSLVTMKAKVVLLRSEGHPKRLPLIRELKDVPEAEVIEGRLAFEHDQRTKKTGLLIRYPDSAPGTGVRAALFTPRISKVHADHTIYVGMEIVGDAVHGQEWMVFPDIGSALPF